MLEDEIRNLTAAIKTLTSTTEALVTATMQLRSSLHSTTGNAEDDAYRAGLQAGRDASVEKAAKKPRAEKAAPAPEKIAEKIAEPAAEPAAPPPADPAPSISKENLKAMALSISRADTSAKPLIFEILGKYGAKTITALPDDPAALYDVFTGFTKIANKIAKDGE
jgi:hypothetical protein